MDIFKIFKRKVAVPIKSDGGFVISTKVKHLKRVWEILHDVGLEGLLTGKWGEVNEGEVYNHLLRHGKLNELCQAITGVKADFEELEFKEVGHLLSDFFTVIHKEFYEFIIQILSIVMKVQQEPMND